MTGDGIIEGGSASSFRGNVTGGMDKSFSRFSKSMQSYDKKDVLMPLGVIFSAIIFGSAVGAASYRRKAKELARKYPHRFEPPPAVKSGSVVEPPIQYGQVRARDVLTGREIFKLFALPGAISIVICSKIKHFRKCIPRGRYIKCSATATTISSVVTSCICTGKGLSKF